MTMRASYHFTLCEPVLVNTYQPRLASLLGNFVFKKGRKGAICKGGCEEKAPYTG